MHTHTKKFGKFSRTKQRSIPKNSLPRGYPQGRELKHITVGWGYYLISIPTLYMMKP